MGSMCRCERQKQDRASDEDIRLARLSFLPPIQAVNPGKGAVFWRRTISTSRRTELDGYVTLKSGKGNGRIENGSDLIVGGRNAVLLKEAFTNLASRVHWWFHERTKRTRNDRVKACK